MGYSVHGCDTRADLCDNRRLSSERSGDERRHSASLVVNYGFLQRTRLSFGLP